MLSCFLLVINHVCSSPVQPTRAKEQEGRGEAKEFEQCQFLFGFVHSTKLDVSSAMSHTSRSVHTSGRQGSSH